MSWGTQNPIAFFRERGCFSLYTDAMLFVELTLFLRQRKMCVTGLLRWLACEWGCALSISLCHECMLSFSVCGEKDRTPFFAHRTSERVPTCRQRSACSLCPSLASALPHSLVPAFVIEFDVVVPTFGCGLSFRFQVNACMISYVHENTSLCVYKYVFVSTWIVRAHCVCPHFDRAMESKSIIG